MNGKKMRIVFILAAVACLLTGGSSLAMPRSERTELPNHLKLLVFEEHSLPIVTMSLLVSAGSWRDPPDMRGLANMTAKAILLGTRFMSFDEVNNKLDFIGATLDGDCTKDFALISMQLLKKDLAEGVDIFTEIIIHPSFPSADIDGLRDDLIGSLRTNEDDPIEVAYRAFNRALFVDNPYAGPVDGTEKSVAAIGDKDLSQFYNSFYRPNDSVLVIGGDITPEEVKTLIVPKLTEWKAAEIPEARFKKEFAEGSVNVDIDKPVSQATIMLGCPAMDRASPDYYPFLVLNQIVGSGDLYSRLMIEIRVKKGLAYAVEGALEARKYAGSFRIILQTKDSSAKEAIALAEKELERLQNEPVSDEELQAAKQYLIGNFPLKYNSQQDYARFLAQAEFYGLGADFADRFAGLINAVTAKDVLRVARKYIKPENVTVIVADLKKAELK